MWNTPGRVGLVTAKTIGFRPNEEDLRILDQAAQSGETTSDTIRRGLRLLAQQRWLDQFHADAALVREENLNDEPEGW